MDILNKNEKKEIYNDVKLAINKARGGKRRSSNKKIYIISIAVIFLVFFVGIYVFFNNNPKTLFLKSMNEVFSDLLIPEPALDVASGNINIVYNGKNETVTYSRDYDNNIIVGTVVDNLFDESIDFYIDDHEVYVLISSISDKYIKLDSGTFYSGTYDEINTLINEMNSEIVNVLNLQKFDGKKSEVIIDNKNVKAYCSSLILTDDIMTSIFDRLKENKTFVNTYSTIMNVSYLTGQAQLLNIMNDFKNKFSGAQIKFYTTGINHKVVMIKIVIDNETYTITKGDNYVINYDNNEIVVGLDKKNVSGFINIDIDEEESSFNEFNLKEILTDEDSVNKAKTYLDNFFD